MDKEIHKGPTVEDLLQDLDQDAKGKTYAQLAEEYPEKAGLKVLASREAHLLHEHLDSGEPSPDYRMPETLRKILAFEAEISPLAPYLDGPNANKGES